MHVQINTRQAVFRRHLVPSQLPSRAAQPAAVLSRAELRRIVAELLG